MTCNISFTSYPSFEDTQIPKIWVFHTFIGDIEGRRKSNRYTIGFLHTHTNSVGSPPVSPSLPNTTSRPRDEYLILVPVSLSRTFCHRLGTSKTVSQLYFPCFVLFLFPTLFFYPPLFQNCHLSRLYTLLFLHKRSKVFRCIYPYSIFSLSPTPPRKNKHDSYWDMLQ